jgi:L-lysine 2,3-aminomutase
VAASPRGWATFAWQSDYGQFYLVDEAFLAPVEITAEMEARCLSVMSSGITVYTQSCLQQHIRVAIYDREPDHPLADPMSDKPWTHVETVEVRFPREAFRFPVRRCPTHCV